jgi:cell wall-associated NlpC family hydrolase
MVPACSCSSTGDSLGEIPPGSLPGGYQIPVTAPPQVQTAIRWALGQLSTPYQWGGTCINAHGNDRSEQCDCSSLMRRAYGVASQEITRTTYTQIHDGHVVPASAIQPGDLLFAVDSTSRPEHVAMVIGYGYVVHAPKPGRVVEVVPQPNLGPILLVVRVV